MSVNNLSCDEILHFSRHINLVINLARKFIETNEDCPAAEDMWIHLTSIIEYAYKSKRPTEVFKRIVNYEEKMNQIR